MPDTMSTEEREAAYAKLESLIAAADEEWMVGAIYTAALEALRADHESTATARREADEALRLADALAEATRRRMRAIEVFAHMTAQVREEHALKAYLASRSERSE